MCADCLANPPRPELPGLVVLRERRNWLTARIAAKRSVGWDTEWDARERDALAEVIAYLERNAP